MIDDIMNPDEGRTPDQPLEPRLADAARAYNPPPSTPREAMWARIAEARRAGGAGGAGTTSGETPAITAAPVADTKVVSIDAARGRRQRARTWVVLAGTLAAGIAIGVVGGRTNGDAPATGSTVAVAPAVPTTGDTTDSITILDTGSTRQLAAQEEAPRPIIRGTRPTGPGGTIPPRTQGTSERLAQRGAPTNDMIAQRPSPSVTPDARPEAPARGANQLYLTAAVQTLSQAEALLVAWRVDAPRDSAAARQLGRWARDVLGSTRLLLDSPAASDQRLRALLDDLELVLAQIVQLSGAPLTDEERALLERSVRDRDLLPRIRSAVPAGATSI